MHIPCQRAIGIRATRGQSSRAGRKRNALPTSSPSRRRCDGEYAGHGDDSVIWVSGPAGGALAFGRVTGYPAPATEAQLSDPYWAETHRPKPSDMFLPIEVRAEDLGPRILPNSSVPRHVHMRAMAASFL